MAHPQPLGLETLKRELRSIALDGLAAAEAQGRLPALRELQRLVGSATLAEPLTAAIEAALGGTPLGEVAGPYLTLSRDGPPHARRLADAAARLGILERNRPYAPATFRNAKRPRLEAILAGELVETARRAHGKRPSPSMSPEGSTLAPARPRLAERIDLLILCPHRDEIEPYLDLSDVGINVRSDVLHGFEVVRFTLRNSRPGKHQRRFRVLAAICGFGDKDAAPRTSQLLFALNPACVVLSGVCAGDPERDVRKGDVVFARSVWDHGAGKREVRIVENERFETIQHDVRVFETRRQWTESARSYRAAFVQEHGERLEARFPDRAELRRQYGDDRHDGAVQVHIGDVATVPDVTIDEQTFPRLQQIKRYTLALEMEATAVANVAIQADTPWMMVKGVQDHASYETSAGGEAIDVVPAFRSFAAYAARTFVLAFCAQLLGDTARWSLTVHLPRDTTAVDEVADPLGVRWFPVRRKLGYDFDQSVLRGPGAIQHATETAKKNLRTAGLLKPSKGDVRLVVPKIHVLTKAYSGTPSKAALEAVHGLGDLRVSCSAIYPAAVATFLSIRARYLPGLALDFETVNSIELVGALDRQQEYDFVVSAEDPFFLVGTRGTFKYRRIMPILKASQWWFQRAGQAPSGTRLLYIPQGSSGATQFMGGLPFVSGVASQGIESIDVHQRALQLEPGELIVAWDPIADQLAHEPSLEKVANSRYDIHVSLYCYAANWATSEAKRNALSSFVELFIAEWRSCAQDLDYCMALLQAEEEYLSTFLLGAGVRTL